jgi:UDP-N-acetylglucosamine transferase subunit ALG13
MLREDGKIDETRRGDLDASYPNTKYVVVKANWKGEHVDDHQLEIARELEMEGEIMAVYDIEELEKALNNPSVFLIWRLKMMSG